MKRHNRRSNRTIVSDSSSPAQHLDGERSVRELVKGHEALNKGESCSARKVKEDDSQKLKAQKVQLLCKLKLESVQYRISRASFEREALQHKKEQRRKEYEMRKLLALNQRQKLVIQRKTEEASLAGKRLNDLLQCRKAAKSGTVPVIQGLELELKVAARVGEIQSEYDRRMKEMAEEVQKYEEEAEMLRQENFRCLVEGKEVDCAVQDSELRDLREEVVRLSKSVCQFGMPKVTPIHSQIAQVDTNQSSISVGSSIKSLNIDASESENSAANAATMAKSGSGPCCSCSSKSLCMTRKCKCKAAAPSSCCGPRCKCAASRCQNREKLTKVDDSLHDDQPPRKPLSEIGNTLVCRIYVKILIIHFHVVFFTHFKNLNTQKIEISCSCLILEKTSMSDVQYSLTNLFLLQNNAVIQYAVIQFGPRDFDEAHGWMPCN